MRDENNNFDLDFTGERLIPGKVEKDLYHEHIARYLFAMKYVEDKTVLDAGCGAGYGTHMLQQGGCSKVVGIDISADAISYAKAHYQEHNIEFMVQECGKTSFPDKHFDMVVSFEVLEHIEEYGLFIKEVKRVLKEDGVFIVSTPNKKSYTDEREGYKNPFHVKEFYLEEFREALIALFPSITIFGQSLSQGFLINKLPSGEDGSENVQRGFMNELDSGKRRENIKEANYFIAVCRLKHSGESVEDDFFYMPTESDALKKMTAWAKGLDEEVKERRQYIVALQKQFDERTAWALSLDKELKARNETIVSLQKESKERTDWALKLDKELKERTDWALKLDQQARETNDRLTQNDRDIRDLRDQLENLRLEKESVEKGLKGRIAELQKSLSWRMTAPLRRIIRLFTGQDR